MIVSQRCVDPQKWLPITHWWSHTNQSARTFRRRIIGLKFFYYLQAIELLGNFLSLLILSPAL